MATIEKTFTFTTDREAVNARAAASRVMTPEERCRAMMARMSGCRKATDYLVRGAF